MWPILESTTASSPSAPEQLVYLLEKRSGLATDLQAEIDTLQVKVLQLYTEAMRIEKEEFVETTNDDINVGYAAAADTDEAPLAIDRIATTGDAGGGVGGGGGGGSGGESEGESKRAGGEEEEEEDVDVPHIEWLQDEVLCIVFSQLDPKTLMVSVPQVCKLWRAVCQDIQDVHLDFSWWRGIITPPASGGGPKIPAEVFAGWRQAPLTAGGGLKTGLCELFPRTTSVTMNGGYNYWYGEIDDIWMHDVIDVTNAAVVALADKCSGITYADFSDIEELTDVAVMALADKCPGITHAAFSFCPNLTDAAVIALADKCPGITHANFYECENLTDAAMEAVRKQRPNCSFHR
eukprot:gene32568-biopygen30351